MTNQAVQNRIAELEAAQPWQPIETAPKDDRPMWLKFNYGAFIGRRLYGTPSGLWTVYGTIGSPITVNDPPEYHPTHWMPIPQPPEETLK